MKIKFNYGLSLVYLFTVLFVRAEYKKIILKEPALPKKSVTYFADDERYAVALSFEDIRKIENILKPHITFDEDYNKRIDRGFIRRMVGACRCGTDAELLEMVLTDFKSKTVQELYTALGLRREL